MSLASARDGILDTLKENLAIVASGDAVLQIGKYFEELTQLFQGLAICNLLTTMEPAGFVKNLALSGFTRRYFLRRYAADGHPDNEYLAISRTSSFFDAIAAGALPLAKEIAAASPRRWFEEGEYADDYAYVAFFHAWVLGDGRPNVAELETLVAQLLEANEGSATPRSAVCESFLKRDADAFAAAFGELLANRQLEVSQGKLLAGDDLTFDPRAAVFVEGLALLALAEQAGFPTEEEYEQCPSAARIRSAQPLPDDLYVDIDRIIRR